MRIQMQEVFPCTIEHEVSFVIVRVSKTFSTHDPFSPKKFYDTPGI